MSGQTRLTIRQRQESDLDELGGVLVRVHDADGYPVEGVDHPHRWLQPPRELAAWTAHWDGRPIGHVSLTDAGPEDDAARMWVNETDGSLADIAVVVRLFVDPEHRGHGAGQELMRAAYEYAADFGRRLVFDVMLKDKKAIGLYEALGCERLGLITHGHSGGLQEPAVVYAGPRPAATSRPVPTDTSRRPTTR